MAQPTVDEVREELAKLEAIKDRVRAYSGFGDNNRAAIRADIYVLKEHLRGHPPDVDNLESIYEYGSHEFNSARSTLEWIEGEEEMSPSKGWADLVDD